MQSGLIETDACYQYVVACDLIKDATSLRKVIDFIKETLGQEAIYVEYAGHAEVV